MKKTFEEFTQAVVEGLFQSNQEFRASLKVKTNEVIKNNGVKLTGINIQRDDCNVSPNIYAEDLYKAYTERDKSIEEIIAEVEKQYLKGMEEYPSFGFDTDFLKDYGWVKERLSAKLLNAEMNEELLARAPHILIGDLAVAFIIVLPSKDGGQGTILISEDMLNSWCVTKETLLADAISNFDATAESMLEVLSNMMGITKEELENSPFAPAPTDVAMMVVSNKSKTFGAFAMIEGSALKQVSEKVGKNLYILPSSVHELIIVPDEGKADAEALKSMVREVNDTQVSKPDLLSYNVYYYDAEANELKYADTKETIYSYKSFGFDWDGAAEGNTLLIG